jgi:hypothetical protein
MGLQIRWAIDVGAPFLLGTLAMGPALDYDAIKPFQHDQGRGERPRAQGWHC